MKKMCLKAPSPALARPVLWLLLIALISPGCQKIIDEFHPKKEKKPVPELPGYYVQTRLVANRDGYGANRVDPLLINAWGIAFSAGGTPWIGAQGGHVSTIYNAEGLQQLAPVGIPSPGGPTGGNPTGVAFNPSNTDFLLSNGQAGRFLFVGVDGIISGWNPAGGNPALLIRNNSATSSYTGVALAMDGGAAFLYLANFRARTIDVLDRLFNPVTNKPFIDPNLPPGYSPFNIQLVGDKLYVAYAKIGPDGRDVPGVGNGFVNVFSTAGVLLKHFAEKGYLNAPWGIALAPASFFKGDPDQSAILIGNFGDGKINAYATDGKFLGQLLSDHKILEIDGLWAISFPPSTSPIDPNRLYFAAGPNHEQDGLFGYIKKE
jgi:uncharacterized protein (TIGR03118 family)